MKKFLFTYLLSLVVILGYSTEYERYLQTTSAGDFFFLFSSGIKYAQTFTVGNTGANESFVIDSIHIGATVGDSWQNVTIEIQTVSSEIPTGTVISNKVSYNLYTQMIIMSPAALQPSTKYAIVMYDEITSNGISSKVVGSSDYTGGKLLYKNGSDPWTDAVTNPTIIPTDLMRFRIYGKHAPIITSQPTSITRCAGTSATFSVVVDSDSPIYQWRKGGSNISGATSSSYTISSVVSGSAGNYDCVVTESLLGTTTTSNTVTLTVPTTTSISGHPTSISRCVGTSATFSVTAAGTGLTYQWKKNGSNISGQTGTSYTISSVATGDAANYTVTVTGTCGTVTSNTATLTVNTPPSITSHPSSGTGCEGFTLNLSVTATGSSLTYQWRRNAVNISGATSSTYSKSGITTADAGSYTCVVTGTCGSATSNEAIIVVLTTPTMTSHPSSATVCYQDNITLSATATGGSLSYQWKLDNVNISGAVDDDYTISSLDYQDIGVYTLYVSNLCGSTTSNPATLTMNTESYLPLRNNLVSYWDMESAASTEEDIAGSNDATVSGATSVTLGTNPPFGKAYSFDGTNDRLTMSAASLGNNLTLSAWVNASTTGLVSRNIIARTNYGTDGIGISSTGKWYGQYAGTTVYSSSNYTTGWHYITFTYDYSTGYMRLYVDGSQVGSGTNAIYAETNAAASWSIGSSGSSSRYWSGYIDEVSMFNRVLSASEILGIYNSGVVEGYNVFLTTCDTEPIPETRRKKILLAGKLRNIILADIERDFGASDIVTVDTTLMGINKVLTDQDYDGVCPTGETWETDCDCAVNYFSRAPLRAIADAADFANVKYIDFTDTGSTEAGTEAEPYNSWDDWTWAANTAYLFKRGVVYSTSSEIVINDNNVLLGTYGTGDTAIIRGSHVGHTISLDGTGNLYTLLDLKFEAPIAYDNIIATNVRNSNCAVNIGKTLGDSYVKVDMKGCQVYNSPFGLRCAYPVAELRVINCDLHKTATEGAYPQGNYVEFRHTRIYDINRWAITQPEIDINGGTNNGSTGDGIEILNWNQLLIANCLIDHGSTKNKGTIMLHSDKGEWIQEKKIIAYNVLVGPENGSTAVQTVNQSSSAKGLLFKGNLCFESPLNNNETVGFWNGSAGADTVINSIFVGYGIAVYQSATDNSLYDNNTFYDNTNCMYAASAKTIPSFRNNITYNNVNVFTNITATSNSNNVSSNPSFVNPTLLRTTADFSLQSGSSAINAGATIDYVPIDIEGNTRVSGQYDAGAYEYQGESSIVNVCLIGNSIMGPIYNLFITDGDPYIFTNIANSGDGILKQTDAWDALTTTKKQSFDCVLLEVGINSVGPGAVYHVSYYQTLINHIKADVRPDCIIVAATITVGNGSTGVDLTHWLELNAAIRGEGPTPITGITRVMTTNTTDLDANGDYFLDAPYNISVGNVHPNTAGTAVMKANFLYELQQP